MAADLKDKVAFCVRIGAGGVVVSWCWSGRGWGLGLRQGVTGLRRGGGRQRDPEASQSKVTRQRPRGINHPQ